LRDYSILRNENIKIELEQKDFLIKVASFACVGVILVAGIITAFMLNKINSRSHMVVHFFVQINKTIKLTLLQSVTKYHTNSVRNSEAPDDNK
jgi:hypothetical protein